MTKRITTGLLALFVAFAVSAQGQKPAQTPAQVITSAANDLSSNLSAHSAEYKKDPEALYAMIDSILSKVFDKRYAGARVLGGQVWRSATDKQKTEFVNALYNSLVRTYGDAVLGFDRDALKVIPARVAPEGNRATVQTQMKLDDGTEISVDYRLRLTGNQWKVYDVLVEGISYISNYQSEYAQKIQQEGLDTVIAELNKNPIQDKVAPKGDSASSDGSGS